MWTGIAFGRTLSISADNERILLHNTSEEDFNHIWNNYFDLDRDYGKILELFAEDSLLKKLPKFSREYEYARTYPNSLKSLFKTVH